MVITKLSQPWHKQSVSCCIVSSVLALRAQSSANRKSLMTVFFTLQQPSGAWGWTCRRQSCIWPVFRPGSYGRHQSAWPRIPCWREQPCFTPFVTGEACESSPSSTVYTIMPSCNWRITSTLSSTSRLCSPYQRLWSGQRRSTKVTKRSLSRSRHFSWSWLATNIMSHVPSEKHTGILVSRPAQNVGWGGWAGRGDCR